MSSQRETHLRRRRRLQEAPAMQEDYITGLQREVERLRTINAALLAALEDGIALVKGINTVEGRTKENATAFGDNWFARADGAVAQAKGEA